MLNEDHPMTILAKVGSYHPWVILAKLRVHIFKYSIKDKLMMDAKCSH